MRRPVAICICTRNRPQELARALASVDELATRPAQLLVADDSDREMTPAVRDVWARHPDATYVSGPRRGLAANRNACLDLLDPMVEAVSFVDDDVVLPSDFVNVAFAALRSSPEFTIVTGHEYQYGHDVRPHNLSFWGHLEEKPREEAPVTQICINATLFPRALFDLVRFDEFLRYGSEEADIAAQAQRAGYRIISVEEFVVEHRPSAVGRAEYRRFVEASRLYATYKRYRWLESSPTKAAAYAILAPLQLIGALIHRRQFELVPDAVRAAWIARQGVAAYRRARREPATAVRRSADA
jgi:GT2 family glycosyltransferase